MVELSSIVIYLKKSSLCSLHWTLHKHKYPSYALKAKWLSATMLKQAVAEFFNKIWQKGNKKW